MAKGKRANIIGHRWRRYSRSRDWVGDWQLTRFIKTSTHRARRRTSRGLERNAHSIMIEEAGWYCCDCGVMLADHEYQTCWGCSQKDMSEVYESPPDQYYDHIILITEPILPDFYPVSPRRVATTLRASPCQSLGAF